MTRNRTLATTRRCPFHIFVGCLETRVNGFIVYCNYVQWLGDSRLAVPTQGILKEIRQLRITIRYMLVLQVKMYSMTRQLASLAKQCMLNTIHVNPQTAGNDPVPVTLWMRSMLVEDKI